ncbi:hypothetical protein ACFVH6_32420 [Spirillospora sp. NPDC127200]
MSGTGGRIARLYAFDEAPAAMRAAAEPYLTRFGTRFATLVHFDRALLAELQQAPDGALPPGLRMASDEVPGVVADMDEITEIANLRAPTLRQRAAYRDALLRIYRSLPVDAEPFLTDPRTLCVAPEREGRQLAAELGWLPPGRHATPSAKRIPFDGGLLVGLSAAPLADAPDRCLLIDGVVASGATLMAVLTLLRGPVSQVTLLTAHSTAAGMWALHRYAAALGIDCALVAGHVSGTLNDHFYATAEGAPGRMVLGDVGDTISDLPAGLGPARTDHHVRRLRS